MATKPAKKSNTKLRLKKEKVKDLSVKDRTRSWGGWHAAVSPAANKVPSSCLHSRRKRFPGGGGRAPPASRRQRGVHRCADDQHTLPDCSIAYTFLTDACA